MNDAPSTNPLLELRDLSVSFPASSGAGRRVRAADKVNLSVFRRQTLAVVGESGSGKSVSALSILQLIPTPPGSYDGGSILWRPKPEEATYNLLSFDDRRMRDIRGNKIAMIFQEPMTSLNPVYTVGEQILEAILLHQQVNRAEARSITERSLEEVGIGDPASRLKEYPHQLSGGMRQRVMIAMALACQPDLLLADEPTTALDVTIQAQILELLRHLQVTKRMAILLITHDLGVVAENADVVAVMYAGRIVEYADVHTVFNRPLHPYTRGLLKSMPVLGSHTDRLPTVTDGATIPDDLPLGYIVAPHVVDPNPDEPYGGRDAQLYEVEDKHWLLCTAKAGRPDLQPSAPVVNYRRPTPVTA